MARAGGWSEHVVGLVLSAFYFGYIVLQVRLRVQRLQHLKVLMPPPALRRSPAGCWLSGWVPTPCLAWAWWAAA